MKKSIKLLVSLLTLSAMLFPVTAKAPRSMKGSAYKIKTIKDARKLAENYQLKTLFDSQENDTFPYKEFVLLGDSLRTRSTFRITEKRIFHCSE